MVLQDRFNGQVYFAHMVNAMQNIVARYAVQDVKTYGAIGDGLGTTIAAAGGDIDTIRTDSGQAWLEETDTMDLAAFYLAQAAGPRVYFPRDDYVFSAPGFLHADTMVDLGGSSVTNLQADPDTRGFVRSNRVFILGILAREDFDRFDSQGWTQQADTAAQNTRTLANVTGTLPSAGDTLMLRTLASTSSPTLPDYVTWNEVVDAVGTTVTLRYPLERAITSVRFVNYNAITTLKSTLAPGPPQGEPHAYYCASNCRLVNGLLRATDGPAFEVNAALNFEIDVEIDAPKGQAVYGNGWNRGNVTVRGVCGGPKGPIELAVGSALTTVEVDLRYSGDDTADEMGSGSGAYPHIQLGEYTESCVITGVLNMGSKPANHGFTSPTGNRNTVDVTMIGHGITANAIVFASNAGEKNTVRGTYDVGDTAGADYFCIWSAGTGARNFLLGAKFFGTVSTNGLRFSGPTLGGAIGCHVPNGTLTLDSGALGNVVLDTYVDGGITSGGDRGSRVRIATALGFWPEDNSVIVAVNLTATELASMAAGRTIINTGATALRTRTLPVSVANMRMKYVRDSASFALRIDPNGTEIVGAGGAGKYLELQSNGAWVKLECNVPGKWEIAGSGGTIAYEP